jgi:hypothetical protein
VCFSGTGALAIFLRKTYGVDITTSDYDDKDIEENIAHNCRVNNLDLLPHIRRKKTTNLSILVNSTLYAPLERGKLRFDTLLYSDTWGDPFPVLRPDWNMVIASDILLCKCIPCFLPIMSRYDSSSLTWYTVWL